MASDRSGYLGNDSLPAPGYVHTYTEWEIAEYEKCMNDPVYFTKTYMKIINVDKGLMNFELWDFQEDMIRTFDQNRFVVMMTARQVGKSTVVLAYFLHYILFNQNVGVCIAANKQETAIGLLDRLKLAYEHIPRFLQQGVVEWNKKSIKLANGSKAIAAATSSAAVRGGSYNALLLDEFAFVAPNVAEAFYTSVYPTISSGKTTKIFIVSTPNGYNLFHKFWIDAKAKRSNFVPVFVHWTAVPGRDQKWAEDTIKGVGADRFSQEFECNFLAGEGTLVSGAKLASLATIDPLETTLDGTHAGLHIFEYPDGGNIEYLDPTDLTKTNINPHNPTTVFVGGGIEPLRLPKTYVICVDTGFGKGLDSSALWVIDVSKMPYNVVATYQNNTIDPLSYPLVVYTLAIRYNNAYVLVEVNDIGKTVSDALHWEYEYEYLISSVTKARTGSEVSGGASKQSIMGLRQTMSTKRTGAATLKTLIEQDQLMLNDNRILGELSTFVKKGTSFAAQEGASDDLVTPGILFGWLTTQNYFIDLTSQNIRNRMRRRSGNPFETALPASIGVIQNGTEHIPSPSILTPDDVLPQDNWLLMNQN